MIGKKIRYIRCKEKISKFKLSHMMNKPIDVIKKWEKGYLMPNDEELRRLCNIFNKDLSYFFESKNRKKMKMSKISFNKYEIGIFLIMFLININIGCFVYNNYKSTYDEVYEVNGYEIESIALKLNDKYYVDVKKIMQNASFKYHKYSILPSEYYSVSNNYITPIMTGEYYIQVEIENFVKRDKYKFKILKIYCYDEENMIEVNNYQDLMNINHDRKASYILCDNIDLSQYKDFMPIASNPTNVYFEGVFINPNGYKISNLHINNTSTLNGLFGNVRDAYIDGILLENIYIDNSNNVCENTIGGLIGIAKNSLIINCKVNGVIIGNHFIGGLIGNIYNSTIKNCEFDGTIVRNDIKDLENSSFVGGLAAYIYLAGGNIKENSITNNKILGKIIASKNIGLLAGMIKIDYNMSDDECIYNNTLNIEIEKK